MKLISSLFFFNVLQEMDLSSVSKPLGQKLRQRLFENRTTNTFETQETSSEFLNRISDFSNTTILSNSTAEKKLAYSRRLLSST